jgi:hypothetical protein
MTRRPRLCSDSVTLEVHKRNIAAVFPLLVLLAVGGRSPLIDQTIHTVFLAPATLMKAFFGFFFSPALSRKDDQFQPESEKIVAGPRHAAQCEELRLPMQARVMMNRRFGEVVTGPAKLIDHLRADDAARRGQPDALNGLASH